MELESKIDFLINNSIFIYLGFGVLCSAILYLFFDRKREFSESAMQNTMVSILCFATNLLAGIVFLDEINAFLQAAYAMLSLPHLDPQFWVSVPLPVMVIIGLLATDFVAYWNHRFLHTTWLWPTHAAHHSDTHVNAFTSFRVHFFESIVGTASQIVILTWLQMPETVPIVIVLSVLYNMYQHIDLDIHHGPFKYVLGSPRYHRWHHADVPEAHGKNLADMFPFYDLLFGTYYVPGPCNEQMGTLESGIEDRTIFSLIAYPFVAWSGLLKEVFGIKPEEVKAANNKPVLENTKMENL